MAVAEEQVKVPVLRLGQYDATAARFPLRDGTAFHIGNPDRDGALPKEDGMSWKACTAERQLIERAQQ
jgi:hypothetical protein